MVRNKVETLRSICFTIEDLSNITNLGDVYTPKDIEFMVEFKKIYELGLTQLKKFIDKLDSEGNEIDEYSIQYYVKILLNGPLGSYVRGYSEGKKYFSNIPDCLGQLGNKTRSISNTTIISNDPVSLGSSVDINNKLPRFMQLQLQKSIEETESIFRDNMKSSTVHDNTLPLVDKKPEDRSNTESSGTWVLKPNGSYCVKDSYQYKVIEKISNQIFEKIKDNLGSENFRIFSDKKNYLPFDSSSNTSTSTNSKITKKIPEISSDYIEEIDLMGDVIDTFEKRNQSLKISSDSGDKEYKMNTVKGNFGN
jgi:hypothetical protein